MKTITEAALPSVSGETAQAHFAAFPRLQGPCGAVPVTRLISFSKAALDLQPPPPSGANSTGCTKNLSSISLSHSYYSAVGGASSIKHFHFIFFFSLPPPREERRKITLKPNREAMIKSESKANNTEDRTERRKKKVSFGLAHSSEEG